RITPSVAEQEGQQTETEATGAPQKHHYTLNQQVGSITDALCKRITRSAVEGKKLNQWRRLLNSRMNNSEVFPCLIIFTISSG
ncbi:hypothetical protein, partial [Klebsiella pneumoniae]|uniref:hypothetical protein n=1 Tax=Klebsiella pneumoniae TaxID=573 RepID=UPI003F0592B0